MRKKIEDFIPVIKGVELLFAPFVEIAVHDLISGKISHLFGSISNRKVGQSSPVFQLDLPVQEFPDVFNPYYETNWDGRKIKCTTVTIRSDAGKPTHLICFNFDTSFFQDMHLNLSALLQVDEKSDNPVELHATANWHKKVDGTITDFLVKRKLVLSQLNISERRELVEALAGQGVFFIKNAAPYVANKLGVSRATIYNYLKVLRAEEQ